MRLYLKVAKNESADLAEALGITEPRRVELSEQMDIIYLMQETVAMQLKRIHTVSKTDEEFAFCCFTHALFLIKRGHDNLI